MGGGRWHGGREDEEFSSILSKLDTHKEMTDRQPETAVKTEEKILGKDEYIWVSSVQRLY